MISHFLQIFKRIVFAGLLFGCSLKEEKIRGDEYKTFKILKESINATNTQVSRLQIRSDSLSYDVKAHKEALSQRFRTQIVDQSKDPRFKKYLNVELKSSGNTSSVSKKKGAK